MINLIPSRYLLLSLLCISLSPAIVAQSLPGNPDAGAPDNILQCSLETISGCPGDIWIPVVIHDGLNLGSISLRFSFNPAVIQYEDTFAYVHPGMGTGFLNLSNNPATQLSMAWYSTTGFTINNDTLIAFKFHYSGGVTALTWDLSNCSFTDNTGNSIAATYQNGEVNSNGVAPVINQQPQSCTVLVGNDTSFYVLDSNVVFYTWQLSTDGGTTWVAVPDTVPYSGVHNDTLLITSVPVTYNGYKYRCELTSICPLTLYSDPATLLVQLPFIQAFHENFEAPGFADSIISSQSPQGLNHWNLDTSYYSSGNYSINCLTPMASIATLTTQAFSTVGLTTILLNFNHICIVDVLDFTSIWASNDDGTTWVQADCAEYLGNGLNCPQSSSFANTAYPVWSQTVPGQLPDNSWWVSEYFDLTSLISNTTNAKIRFQLQDGGIAGPNGMYGWLIDDIRVFQANYFGGQVVYANQAASPLLDSTLVVLQGPVNRQIPVDAGGGYSFTDLPPGNYTLTATTTKKGGGWNGTDIYLIFNNLIQNPPMLSGIYLHVADVNNSGGIPNASDAIDIKRRYLHQISNFFSLSFPLSIMPDWFFETLPLNIDPTIQSGQVLRGLCTGDPSASFIPF